MSEINGPKFSVNQVNFEGIQKQLNEAPQEEPVKEESQQKGDFTASKAEATIGRSMLFKGSDDVNNDLKALSNNPQIAENSDKLFNTLYSAAKESGMENPYEEAASASTIAM